MIVVLAIIATLWIAALVVLAAAADSRGAVAAALASNEQIIKQPVIAEREPVREKELLAA